MKSYSRLNSSQVAEIMTKGRAVHTSSFLMKYIENKEGGVSIVSFVSSKKNFKTAVLRNKARRRGRAALQIVVKAQKIHKKSPDQDKKGYFVVFLLKPIVLSESQSALMADIEQSLIKSAILNNL